MTYYVAPSFEGKEFLCEPYEKAGKMYVKIMGATAPREIRVYDKPQASWGKTKKANGTEKRVERYNDRFLAFNYPDNQYAYLVGMKEYNGTLGIWLYRNKPNKIYYGKEHNIMLNPLWGYFGFVDREPIAELDPIFVSEEEVRIENGYKRLIDDAWWKEEVKRLQTLSEG